MDNIFSLRERFDGNLSIEIPQNIYDICRNSGGSFNVIKARLFGLSYPSYLRMCRDKYKAILKGKNGYSYTYWRKEDKDSLVELIKELNKRWKVWENKIDWTKVNRSNSADE